MGIGSLIVAGVVGTLLATQYVRWAVGRQRRRILARLAGEMGYSYVGDEEVSLPKSYDFLDLFPRDGTVWAEHLIKGERGRTHVFLFDLLSGTKVADPEKTGRITVALLVLPGQRFPHTLIAPVGSEDDGPARGTERISLGPPEFARKYRVDTAAVGFAREVIEAGAWLPLVRHAAAHVEMHGYALALHRARRLARNEIRSLHGQALQFLEAIPEETLKTTTVDEVRARLDKARAAREVPPSPDTS